MQVYVGTFGIFAAGVVGLLANLFAGGWLSEFLGPGYGPAMGFAWLGTLCGGLALLFITAMRVRNMRFVYSGYRYRSVLDAKWARFFDERQWKFFYPDRREGSFDCGCPHTFLLTVGGIDVYADVEAEAEGVHRAAVLVERRECPGPVLVLSRFCELKAGTFGWYWMGPGADWEQVRAEDVGMSPARAS